MGRPHLEGQVGFKAPSRMWKTPADPDSLRNDGAGPEKCVLAPFIGSFCSNGLSPLFSRVNLDQKFKEMVRLVIGNDLLRRV